jgi:hypothetical protein
VFTLGLSRTVAAVWDMLKAHEKSKFEEPPLAEEATFFYPFLPPPGGAGVRERFHEPA